MEIKVKKKDIKRGVRNNSKMCPVALALRRNGVQRARVHISFIEHGPRDNWRFTSPTDSVRDFISKFDDGKKVKPFKFVFKP